MAMNEVVELEVTGNLMANQIMPKPGTFLLGDGGLEFAPEDGGAHTRVAWDEVLSVDCDIFRGNVREVAVHTTSSEVLPMFFSDAREALRCIASHVGREKIVSVNEEAAKRAAMEPSLADKIRSLFSKR